MARKKDSLINRHLSQLEKFILSEKFKLEAVKIRKKCKIPTGGFAYSKNKEDLIIKGDRMFPPDKKDRSHWLGHVLSQEIKQIENMVGLKNNPTLSLCFKLLIAFKEFDIHSFLQRTHITQDEDGNKINRSYLDELKTNFLIELGNADEMIDSFGVIRKYINHFGEEEETTLNEEQLEKFLDKPIMILLHPEASANDIKEFLQVNRLRFEKLRSKYKTDTNIEYKNAKGFKPSTRRIHKIISENIHNTDKVIQNKIAKSEPLVNLPDLGNINTIKNKYKNKK